MSTSAYRPYEPARRPGGRPTRKPAFRVLVHRQYKDLWEALPRRVGLQSAQQFYDHIAHIPGRQPVIGSSTVMGRVHTGAQPLQPLTATLGEIVQPAIRHPSLLIAGAYDLVTSEDQLKAYAASLPDLQVVRFEQSGHVPYMEEPERPRRGSDRVRRALSC